MEIYGKPYPKAPSEITFRVAHGLRLAGKVWGQPIERKSGISGGVECGDVRIIAAHGFLDNAGSWDLCLPYFLQYFTAAAPNLSVTVVAIDWMGHGMSDHRHRQSDYSTWRYVDDLRYVYEELGWKNAVLFGHSMGGGAVSQFAGTFPDMVTHLVMIDNFGPWAQPGRYAPQALIHHLKKSRALATKTKPTYKSIEAATKARMNGQNPVSEMAAAPLVQRGLMEIEVDPMAYLPSEDDMGDDDEAAPPANKAPVKAAPKIYTWRTDQRLTVGGAYHFNEESCEAYLSRIRCPVLGILAESGHWNRNVRPLLDTRIKLLDECTGDLTVEYVKSTHHLHMEVPELTAKILVDWMKPRLHLLDKTPKKKTKAVLQQGQGVEAKL